jgi:uncharacterized protein (TIGR02466 family)
VPTRPLFPTLLYTAALQARGTRSLNNQLLREIHQLRHDDRAGREWSRANYPGGFTSYASVNRLHEVSPTFAGLAQKLAPHVRAFARQLKLEPAHRKLVMTDCWANIMPAGVAHGLHLHPLSTISGTYYVQTPAGASGLKLEDPRLDRMMAAPRRSAWVLIQAKSGHLVMFESWLRHEVPVHWARMERISVSFNFNWF